MAKKTPHGEQSAGEFMEVGKEVVPGMRLRCICRGHTGPIGRIAWSPCGRFIASPSQDKTIRIWDANSGECLAVLEGREAVYCVAWSPAELLASVVDAADPEEEGVHIWNTAEFLRRGRSDNESARTIPILRTIHQVHGPHGLAWSPDRTHLAICGTYTAVSIWSARTGERVNTIYAVGQHSDFDVNDVRWSPNGQFIATANSSAATIDVLNATTGAAIQQFGSNQPWPNVERLVWFPDGEQIGSVGEDTKIRIWTVNREQPTAVLEGHTGDIDDLAISHDGKVLASVSARDGTTRLWSTDSYVHLASVRHAVGWSVSFSPKNPNLASVIESENAVYVWDLDIPTLLTPRGSVQVCTSAKVVLVGESNVGKSCLAMRLAEDRYPEAHEHGTTHGMRFWPMEAERLHPTAKPPPGQRRDVVLWDFGGQDEYQLVHQMFLHDTTLALVLIDPTRGDVEFSRAREWNKRLQKQLGGRRAVKLLVGAQVDDDKKSGLINRGAIQALCNECGFAGFYETSALTGREIEGFRDALAGAVDWENLAKTSRPELFQRIRDDIDKRRKRGEIVTIVDELALTISRSESWYLEQRFDDEIEKQAKRKQDFAAVRTVIDHLAIQGVIVKTKLTGGDDAIVLQLPVIERYAASLIVAARNNPRGVPALEASELGSPGISLPGMTAEDRVPRGQERIVLEAVVELMIEHGLCFRHEGLLVFPTLLRATETDRADELPGSVSLYYDFSGAIDNVYASLISWLVIGQGFGRIRLWENRVEFEAEGQGACGLRKVSRGGGFAHLDVYFHEATPAQTQTEFISFVHQHLRSSGIDVVEHFELICTNNDCRYEFPRVVVQNRMAKGETDVVCPQCETRSKLSEGFRQERERDERAERKSFALMTRVREDVPKIVAGVKQRAFGRTDDQYRTDRPIRVLHLSDLHFTSDAVSETKMQWLDDDIRKGKWLDGGELDYVVTSGDMTHQGSADGFRRASKFVSLLVERFHLTAERFVLVPGNHDVQDLDEAYDWRQRPTDAEKKLGVQQGSIWLVPNQDRYKERLKEFSDQFYHPLLQKPYPLDPARQGVAYIFPETELQFLTLNSCWEIDQFHRTRASIHPDALARLIAEADRQIDRAIVNTDVKPGDYLRIGVWHHPVADVERGIRNREFLGNLQTNRVRVCLTGDVHEMRRELIDYWHDDRMHVIGAGSFGSKGQDLSEGSPRLYNLLEIERDFSRIRVHTRQQPKPNGAWKGWNEWPMPGHEEAGLSYFDIHLMR